VEKRQEIIAAGKARDELHERIGELLWSSESPDNRRRFIEGLKWTVDRGSLAAVISSVAATHAFRRSFDPRDLLPSCPFEMTGLLVSCVWSQMSPDSDDPSDEELSYREVDVFSNHLRDLVEEAVTGWSKAMAARVGEDRRKKARLSIVRD
jgi:hypothetical protein